MNNRGFILLRAQCSATPPTALVPSWTHIGVYQNTVTECPCNKISWGNNPSSSGAISVLSESSVGVTWWQWLLDASDCRQWAGRTSFGQEHQAWKRAYEERGTLSLRLVGIHKAQ